MKPILSADSCCDLPVEVLEKFDIMIIPLSYTIGDKVYKDTADVNDVKTFYQCLRQGEMATTSQINVQEFIDFFTPFLEQGRDILHISLSSALSGTYGSAMIAKEMLQEKYPKVHLNVIDSLSACMGFGLLVYRAALEIENGATASQTAIWCEENKLKINHWFTVDDLNHLSRGGRISSTSAMVGSILSIKPILKVNDEGRLVAIEKVRGRKHALQTLVEKIAQNAVNPSGQVIMISHGDTVEEAELVSRAVKEKLGVKNVIIGYIGTVIGAHAGPGTLAVFFFGNQR